MTFMTDHSACRELWRRVLLTVVADLCGHSGSTDQGAQRAAEHWVGAFPSRDFRQVCELAGVDPGRAHAALRGLLSVSPKERSAEIKARRRRSESLREAA